MPVGVAKFGLMAAAGVSGFDDEGSWHAINSYECTSNTASVTLDSATSEKPWSDYLDLVLITVGRGTANGNPVVKLTFNDGASGGYQWEVLKGNGTTAASDGTRDGGYVPVTYLIGDDRQDNYFSTSVCRIFDINNTARFTTALIEDGYSSNESSGDNVVEYQVINWENDDQITEFTMVPLSGNFAIGSRFDLYGIKGE